jgi:hypothetical protein
MQQASDYPGQEASPQTPGTFYPPQQPYTPNVAPQARAAQAPLATTGAVADWVRWGPIWAGFLTVVSTLALLGALGAAIKLSSGVTAGSTPFDYAWNIFTGVVAYFLGGWIAGRAAGITNTGSRILNGALVWALSVTVLLLLLFFALVIGISSILGGTSLPLYLTLALVGSRPTLSAVGHTASAWSSFVTLIVALILAVAGSVLSAWQTSTRQVR